MPTNMALGVIYLALTLGMLFNPALRRMDADRAPSWSRAD